MDKVSVGGLLEEEPILGEAEDPTKTPPEGEPVLTVSQEPTEGRLSQRGARGVGRGDRGAGKILAQPCAKPWLHVLILGPYPGYTVPSCDTFSEVSSASRAEKRRDTSPLEPRMRPPLSGK